MAQLDPVIFRELVAIQKIIDDEIWFEGERRGCWVSPDDPVVLEKVYEVILRLGLELRANLLAEMAMETNVHLLPAAHAQSGEAA